MNRINLPHPYIVAPLAGITDYPFRTILRKYTSGLIHTEMITASSIIHNMPRVKKMFDITNDAQPVGIQLVGNDPFTLCKAVDVVGTLNPALIDLNFSCPVKKIIKSGAGAALLLDPDKLFDIAKNVVQISPVPVSAKIRIGFDENHINGIEIAKRLEQAGIAMLTVHGRLRSQFYSGEVDLKIIAKIKKEVNIPVIGNGGLYGAKDVKRMMKTGVDGVQLATGILRRPWMIRELITGEKIEHPEEELIQLIEWQYDLFITYYGERAGIMKMRKFLTYYSRTLPNFDPYVKMIFKSESKQRIEQILDDYISTLYQSSGRS